MENNLNPKSTARNPKSKTVLDFLTWARKKHETKGKFAFASNFFKQNVVFLAHFTTQNRRKVRCHRCLQNTVKRPRLLENQTVLQLLREMC